MRCLTPIYLRSTQLTVPCGKCAACRSRQANDWVVRLEEEFKASRSAYFVTLTYNDNNLPISENGYQTLSKKELQEFINLLRTYCPFRYYAIGEYGDKGERPHYHMLIFNFFPVTNPKTSGIVYHKDWNTLDSTMIMSNVDIEAVIFKAWKKGKVDVQTLDGGAIRYCAYYVVDLTVRSQHNDQQKQFALMSRRPPIGYQYYDKMRSYHRTRRHNEDKEDMYRKMSYQTDFGKTALPRIYKQKMFSKLEIQNFNLWWQKNQDKQFKKVTDIQKYARNLHESHEHKSDILNSRQKNRTL